MNSSCKRCAKQDSTINQQGNKQYLYHKDCKRVTYLTKKFQELYREDQKLKDKRIKRSAQVHQEKEDNELSQCTFNPKINHNSEYFVPQQSFLKRESDWKSSLEKKIATKYQAKQKVQKNAYSFKPEISQFPSKIFASHRSNTNNDKKSYKRIYEKQIKFKQLAKSTIIEPFRHREVTKSSLLSKTRTKTKNESEEIKIEQSEKVNPEQEEIQILYKKEPQILGTEEISIFHKVVVENESDSDHKQEFQNDC